MNLLIEKWGDGLALRIPADYVRHLGLKQGDRVQANLTADGGISIHTVRWNRSAFAQELALIREAMPMSEAIGEQLRRGGRF